MDDVVIPRMVSSFLLGVLSTAPQEISAQDLSWSCSWSLFLCSHIVILLINWTGHPDTGMLKHNVLNYFLHAWWEGIPQHNWWHRAGPERRAMLCLANGEMPFTVRHTVCESPFRACLSAHQCQSGRMEVLELQPASVAENKLREQFKVSCFGLNQFIQWPCFEVYFEYAFEKQIKIRSFIT